MLASPDLPAALSEVGSFLLPREAQLLDWGHDPDELPGGFRRAVLSARCSLSFLKMLGYQSWRLAAHGLSAGGHG